MSDIWSMFPCSFFGWKYGEEKGERVSMPVACQITRPIHYPSTNLPPVLRLRKILPLFLSVLYQFFFLSTSAGVVAPPPNIPPVKKAAAAAAAVSPSFFFSPSFHVGKRRRQEIPLKGSFSAVSENGGCT